MYYDHHEDEWRRLPSVDVYEFDTYYEEDDYYGGEEYGDTHIKLSSDSLLDLNTCLWRGSHIVPQASDKHIASLQELCSRVAGQTLPFQRVLQHQPRVPEEVLKRIAFWSFPLNEKQVLDYGKMMGADIEAVRAEECQVSEMLQTGS